MVISGPLHAILVVVVVRLVVVVVLRVVRGVVRLHLSQPVLMFSVLMVALSVTVCVSQLGGSLACGHLAAGCLPRRPATTASSATGPVTAAPLHSSA